MSIGRDEISKEKSEKERKQNSTYISMGYQYVTSHVMSSITFIGIDGCIIIILAITHILFRSMLIINWIIVHRTLCRRTGY